MKKTFNLAKFRKEHGFTQQKLAQKLNVSQSDISNYEANTDIIPFRVITQLARIFKLDKLNDFFNEEHFIAPIDIPDVFSNLRNIRKQYQEKIYSCNNPVDFNTYLNFFIIERAIYQQIHKPLVFIKAEYEDIQRDFVLAIMGLEFQLVDKNIPIFIVSNEERPLFSTDDDMQKEFPWLKEQILYFRETKHSPIFDITLSCCPAYSLPIPKGSNVSHWENEYVDYFLNIPDISTATCAVIYSNCSQLNACNLVLCPNENQKLLNFFQETADIALDVNYKKNNKIDILLSQQIAKTSKNYPFSFSSDDVNKEFYRSINLSIQAACNRIQESHSNVKSYLKLIYTSMQAQIPDDNLSESDYTKSYSQCIIWKNNISTLLSNINNKSMKIFEKEYTDFTDVKNIENILLKLGKQTYEKNLDKQNSFPCNLADLDKAKKHLHTSFSEKYNTIINKSFILLNEQLQEICNDYECEPFLKSRILEFSKGFAITQTDTNQDFNDDGATLFLSTFEKLMPNMKKTISIYNSHNNEITVEKIFADALKDIMTFSRGFSLSKARKISKALQNFQVHNSLLKILNDFWEEIRTTINAIMSDLLLNFYNNIPKNDIELKKLNEQTKKLKSILSELKEV